jgi:transposase
VIFLISRIFRAHFLTNRAISFRTSDTSDATTVPAPDPQLDGFSGAEAGATPATPVDEQPKPAPRLRTANRQQFELHYSCADELVGPKHRVRTLWAAVDSQDWSAFCEPIKAREGVAGRQATDPKVLAALWLYAATRNVGSARELDRLCKESDPFKWILGGLTVNYHLLASFRVGHGQALDEMFTAILATLADKGLIDPKRIMQDGIRVRAAAGAGSYRSEERLEQLEEAACQHVKELREQIEDPARSSELSARKKAARLRAAEDRQRRLEEAVARLPEMKRKQQEAAERAGVNGQRGQKILDKTLRVSTTDPIVPVMKMPNGGFNPALNIQLAAETKGRAIVGVAVTTEGSDSANLAEPMRQQVEQRTQRKVEEQGLDGGYTTIEDIEKAHAQGVRLFMPPKPARNKDNKGLELEPKPKDSPAILDWKQRMSSDEGKDIYKQRASTSETINADLRQHRALKQFGVRGLDKVTSVVLWCAMAYNVMIFAKALAT